MKKLSEQKFKEKYCLEGKSLGRGGFGKVFKILDKSDREKKLAIKMIDLDDKFSSSEFKILNNLSEESNWEDFQTNMNEVITSCIENSNYLVKIYDYFILEGSIRNSSKFCLIMDFYERDLKKIIASFREKGSQFTIQQISKIMYDVVCGLIALRSNRIAHRD